MKSTNHTVTTTRSLVVPSDNITRTIYLHVLGAGTVYIGGSDVSSANGLLTEKNAIPFQFILPNGEDLWAVTGSGSDELRVLSPSVD